MRYDEPTSTLIARTDHLAPSDGGEDVKAITKVTALFYSATGNTKRLTLAVAEAVAWDLNAMLEVVDFSTPEARAAVRDFPADTLLVIGSPTYRGQLPMFVVDGFRSQLKGHGTAAIELVTFGNRSFDNSLADLTQILRADGFVPVAAAAFPCQHAFTDALAAGRPDNADLMAAAGFGQKALAQIVAGCIGPDRLIVPGKVGAPFYQPLGRDGKPVDFQAAKPRTDPAKCRRCGLCVQLCPLGSIAASDYASITGPCFKCQACVRGCPAGAKYFDDPALLSHIAQLEATFRERKEIAEFFS